MAIKILVMGLPGSGKTTMAGHIKPLIEEAEKTITWFNADDIRKKYNDWDFSIAGRTRQAMRMRELALSSNTDYVLVDFIAPLEDQRQIFQPDIIIWMDTIDQGRFDDTNKMFQPPKKYDFRITEQNAIKWSEYIVKHIRM